MTRFRYEMASSTDLDDLERWVNKMAAAGWQLTHFTCCTVPYYEKDYEDGSGPKWTAVMELCEEEG